MTIKDLLTVETLSECINNVDLTNTPGKLQLTAIIKEVRSKIGTEAPENEKETDYQITKVLAQKIFYLPVDKKTKLSTALSKWSGLQKADKETRVAARVAQECLQNNVPDRLRRFVIWISEAVSSIKMAVQKNPENKRLGVLKTLSDIEGEELEILKKRDLSDKEIKENLNKLLEKKRKDQSLNDFKDAFDITIQEVDRILTTRKPKSPAVPDQDQPSNQQPSPQQGSVKENLPALPDQDQLSNQQPSPLQGAVNEPLPALPDQDQLSNQQPSPLQEAVKDLEDTIKTCSKYSQPMQIKINGATFLLQNLKLSIPENLSGTFLDLVHEGQALQSQAASDSPSSTQFWEDLETTVDKFTTKIIEFEKTIVTGLATDLGITEEVAKQIFEAAQQNWKPFITEHNGIIKQNHNIKGLKIYQLPDGQLVAHFGKRFIGQGGYKRAKEVQQIGGPSIVRLTNLEKDEKGFLEDITHEIAVRSELIKVPNKTEITTIKYYNKKDELKTRYIMRKYDTDIYKMLKSESENFSRSRALQCCSGVFDCLEAMHEAGFNHGDIKSTNVFCLKNEGFVSDFGLSSKTDSPREIRGSAFYCAPETLTDSSSKVWAQSMDMFSMGILLLAITDQTLHSWFLDSTKRIQSTMEKKREKTAKNPSHNTDIIEKIDKEYMNSYKKIYDELQKALADKPTPLRELILNLTSYQPENRPTAKEAKQAFKKIMENGATAALDDPYSSSRLLPALS